jgi:hypothetical protein
LANTRHYRQGRSGKFQVAPDEEQAIVDALTEALVSLHRQKDEAAVNEMASTMTLRELVPGGFAQRFGRLRIGKEMGRIQRSRIICFWCMNRVISVVGILYSSPRVSLLEQPTGKFDKHDFAAG